MTVRILQRELQRGLARAWGTLGVPRTEGAVDETNDGVIDPEALLFLTVLHSSDSRLLADAAAWSVVNRDLLIHQKLASLVRRVDAQKSLAAALRAPELETLPTQTRTALAGSSSTKRAQRAPDRFQKLAPRDAIARRSRVMFNRLLYGASARADIITALQFERPPRTGARLASLLAVDASTVSRVLADLRACRMLDREGRLADAKPFLPGFYVSVATVVSVSNILQAASVKDPELRAAMWPELDVRNDGLGQVLSDQSKALKSYKRGRLTVR